MPLGYRMCMQACIALYDPDYVVSGQVLRKPATLPSNSTLGSDKLFR